MRYSQYNPSDVLFFFDGRPRELALYQAFFRLLETSFPDASVKVQKSQISFYGRHLFAAVSLPLRKAGHGLLITFGLSYQKQSPRIAVSTEPYPGRWTHHVLLSRESELDGELLSWLQESWDFSESKR